MGRVLFHLAFPITDLEEAKRFYASGLGCGVGRASASAITFEFRGHQLIGHMIKEPPPAQKGIYPSHFGLVFTTEEDWRAMVELAKSKGLRFYQEPRSRYPDTRLEHLTFFLEDPFHNLLEFKYYKYESAIFGEQQVTRVGDMKAGD